MLFSVLFSESFSQIVRIRSKDGNYRFDLQPTADISELVAKVRLPFSFVTKDRPLFQVLETTTDADPDSLTVSNQPRGNETLVSTLGGRTLESLGIKYVKACLFSLHFAHNL